MTKPNDVTEAEFNDEGDDPTSMHRQEDLMVMQNGMSCSFS
jgi:hypothetical protein